MVPKRATRVKETPEEAMNDDDRISRLPDGVIHHIFSFTDAKLAVQSSLLARRWRNTWKSHPHLKFEIKHSSDQRCSSRFSNFVHRFLSKRDNIAELSTINFQSNSIGLPLLKEIIIYSMSHRTQKLNIEFSGGKQKRRGGLDLSLFRSEFLQHLSLIIGFEVIISPPLTWDLPSVTTLDLERVTFTLQLPSDDASKSVDLFSRFPNLKTLVLDSCLLSDIDTFSIISSGLESLTLIDLKQSCDFVISAPKLSSFDYVGMLPFSLLATDLLSLKTVNFQTIYHRSFEKQPKLVELMIDAFKQLYMAKSVTLNLDVLRFLLEFPELLEKRPCPFTSLQSLIWTLRRLPRSSSEFASIISYFLSSSPDLMISIELDPRPAINRLRL